MMHEQNINVVMSEHKQPHREEGRVEKKFELGFGGFGSLSIEGAGVGNDGDVKMVAALFNRL